jgi:hypothetical protein
MADDSKKPTQAIPEDGKSGGAPDGVNSQARRGATGGSGDAAPYPNPHSGKSEDEREHVADGPLSHGGQSSIGYHGSGRLGDKRTKPKGNPNAGAGEDR